MDWLKQKIEDTEYWLALNEKQGTLPTMTLEDELFKQEIKHKKEILSLLNQFRHHPLSNQQPKEKIEQKHF